MPTIAGAGEGEPRDARGHRRIEHGDAGDQHQPGDPDQRAVAEMAVPAVEVEVGEQEHHEGRREPDLGAGAPHLLAAGRDLDHLVEEAEVDADIGEHRPGERRRRREHRGALDHEQDRQEQRQQAGDADDDAAEQRVGVDRVLVGVGVPQIDLRQLRRFRARRRRSRPSPGLSVTRKTSASGLGWRSSAKPSLGVIAAMRSEPRSGQNTPEPASRKCGATISRSSCWSLLLASANTAQSPLEFGVAGLDLDAPDDAVGAGRGRDLEILALVAVDLDRLRQVERDVVARDLDRLDRRRAGEQANTGSSAAKASARSLQLRSDEFQRGQPRFKLGRSIAGDQRVEIMILPYAVDSQVGSQKSLALESGFFKQAHRAQVVRNTGCLDPVQPQRLEGMRQMSSPSASSIRPRPA